MDDKFLINNYKKMTNKELALYFKVSPMTISRKLNKLGLSRRNTIKLLPDEVFKDIKDFSKYKVSNKGRFINSENILISQHYTHDGYLSIKMVNDEGVRTTNRSHRLVALSFIPNYDILRDQINHKDGKKDNNEVSNLEWVTQSENQIHAYKNNLNTSLQGSKSHLSNYDENQVGLICKEIEIGKTTKEIMNKYLWIKSKGFVDKIKRKKSWRHVSKNYNF